VAADETAHIASQGDKHKYKMPRKRPAPTPPSDDNSGRVCTSCGTTSTPKWRCAMTLCNACGLLSAKKMQQATRNAAAAAHNPSLPAGGMPPVSARALPGPHKATPYPKPPAAPAPFRPLGQPGAAPYSQPLGLSLSHASHLAHAGMFNLPQPMPGANQLAGAPSNPWAHAPAAAAYPLSVAGYAQAPASATYCAATHMGMPIALCGRV